MANNRKWKIEDKKDQVKYLFLDRWQFKREFIKGHRDKLTLLQNMNLASKYWLGFIKRELAMKILTFNFKKKRNQRLAERRLMTAGYLIKLMWRRYKKKLRPGKYNLTLVWRFHLLAVT